MSAAVTYPGSATPLRGVAEFTEVDRDVLYGRDDERDKVAKLVASGSFRAGLIYGERRVGKTSFLRAGLLPHLRDQGIHSVYCANVWDPLSSLAEELYRLSSVPVEANEPPVAYITRVVGQATDQTFVFVIDGVDQVIGDGGDERAVAQMAEAFARIVPSSGGRARFLFCCAADKVYALDDLERRTGSLFPPSNRIHLKRFSPATASTVLERTVALAGLPADRLACDAAVEIITEHGSISPMSLQLVALAMRDIGVTKDSDLHALPNYEALLQAWVTSLANSSPASQDIEQEKRLLAGLVSGDPERPKSSDEIASRARLDPAFVEHRLGQLAASILITVYAADGTVGYRLADSSLFAPVRETGAGSYESTRRLVDILTERAGAGQRLTLVDWWQLRRAGITPANDAENAAVTRTARLVKLLVATAIAAPLISLVLIYMMHSGNYYYDVARAAPGTAETVVVRAGRSSLSSFHWIPSSPGFGNIIADTGLTREMVSQKTWTQAQSHDIAGATEGKSYVEPWPKAANPELAALVEYGLGGDGKKLQALLESAESPAEKADLLLGLSAVSRGDEQETEWVSAALTDSSALVRSSAVSLAAVQPDAYQDVLVSALTSSDIELRTTALAKLTKLAPREREQLLQAVSRRQAPEEVLRALHGDASIGAPVDGNRAGAAVTVLVDDSAPKYALKAAQQGLSRAFAVDEAGSIAAVAELASSQNAGTGARVFALKLLAKANPKQLAGAGAAVDTAIADENPSIRAAALPVLARIRPDAAKTALAAIDGDSASSPVARASAAAAWGQLAKSDPQAADAALSNYLKDRSANVRAAAAASYGYLGRKAQATLTKMIKTERFDVAIGAAYGLANSARVGASSGVAVNGIFQQWKRKGVPRRRAAKVFAALAFDRPRAVATYLSAAAKSRDDASLHLIGINGLCESLRGGYTRALVPLAKSASDDQVAVRRRVSECVLDHAPSSKKRIALAKVLARDADSEVRRNAATILAAEATAAPTQQLAKRLLRLSRDSVQSVRLVAVRALPSVAGQLPKNAASILRSSFKTANDAVRIELLGAAPKLNAGALTELGLKSPNSAVRIAALGAAVKLNHKAEAAFQAGMADSVRAVRLAALDKLADSPSLASSATVSASVLVAARSSDPNLAQAALAAYVKVGEIEQVVAELERRLGSRSESERTEAANALSHLIQRDPKLAAKIALATIDDSSHDVRRSAVLALAEAWATSQPLDRLIEHLRGSEHHAAKRVAAATALYLNGRVKSQREPAIAALDKSLNSLPPFSRLAGGLVHEMLKGNADGIVLLGRLVP